MLDYAEKILQNTLDYNQVMNQKLPANMNREQVYDCLLDRTKKAREIMKENVELLSDHFEPFFQNPHLIGKERAECYEEFATALFSLNEEVDAGLALHVHKALLGRARVLDDMDSIIRHLYWVGLIYMQWTQHLYVDDSFACFDEVYQYRHLYFSMENRETRLYFNRCLGNRYVIVSQRRALDGADVDKVEKEFSRYADEAAAFWNDEKVRELDPDFPWDGFLRNIDQNTCSWMDQIRGSQWDNRALIERVYRSVERLYVQESRESDATFHWHDTRTAYLVYTSRFHAGHISLSQLLENLKKMVYEGKPGDFSQENVYRILHLSAVYQHYLAKSEDMTDEEKRRETNDLLERAFRFYQEYPANLDKKALDRHFLEFVKHFISDESYKEEIFNLLLRGTSFSHLPTYAHSVMVGELMAIFAEYFVDCKPQLFKDFPGLGSVEAVAENRDRIIEKARLAGYAHDAGKIDYVDTVSISSRKISDLEFDIIKRHASFGHQLFAFSQDRAVLDVILGHHKFYNGKGGYPESYDNTQSLYKFFIDMCSIADIVDAGTDEIGRSYTNPKTLAVLAREIEEGAGWRYSPELAEALKDEQLLRRLEEQISTGRRGVYFRAYRDLYEQHVDEELKAN